MLFNKKLDKKDKTKKGFTLVELLAVIVVIIFLVLILKKPCMIKQGILIIVYLMTIRIQLTLYMI